MRDELTLFDDPRNVVVGQARIIYVPASGAKSAHWALPGGACTEDRFEAYALAVRLEKLLSGAARMAT